MNKGNKINFICFHKSMECSELPRLPPIFSCNACDELRRRMHCVQCWQKHLLDHSSMS